MVRRDTRKTIAGVSLGALLLVPGLASAADPITIVEVRSERPTVHTAGIQVLTSDDDNRNATIEVRVREAGSAAWKSAPPLMRVWPETLGVAVPEQLAGSIFDLQPGTSYEVELHVVDPDGVDETLTTMLTTRAIPRDPAMPMVVPVSNASELSAALAVAIPGHVIELAAGTYVGPFSISAEGTAESPIVIRGDDAGSVILDGNDCGGCNVLEVYGSHVHVESLTLAHATRGLRFLGEGATGNVVRHVIIEDVVHGIGSRPNQTDFYLCDNEVRGRLVWPWVFGGDAGSHWDDRGIEISGDGHVVCHNLIEGFGDPILNMQDMFRAVDVYGNDVRDSFDGIEVDRGTGNVRVFRNRWINVDSAISIQPIHGGPLYVVRNELLNVVSEQIKMKATGGEPSGSIIAHNTFVSPSRALNLQTPITGHNFRIENNLFVGPEQLSGSRTVEWTAAVAGGEFDHNGYFPDGGFWFGSVDGQNRLYDSFAAASASGEVEANGVLLSAATFVVGIVGPVDGMAPASAVELDLAEGSPAIDAGRVLEGIGDAFMGGGPDMGARERGCSAPRFGPRPAGDDSVSPVNCSVDDPDEGSDTGEGDETTGDDGGADSASATAADAGSGSSETGTSAGGSDRSEDAAGCGCRARASRSAWWLALFVLVLVRRRAH